tara:strand:+ start:7822 stop:8250 length:429 start_codon:yes stop_codon:yes gene_type:complete
MKISLFLQRQMKEIIKNIGIILIAAIVLLSSISFTVHKTYCKGSLVNTSVFTENKVCQNDYTDICSLSEDCCSHEKLMIDGQSELQTSVVLRLELEKPFFICSTPKIYFHKTKQTNRLLPPNKYIPPILITQIQPLFQIFRI